jgi:hypothetical protein
MNSFETILMKLYYLVSTGTSPKLDIFEIQYNSASRVPQTGKLKKKFFKKPGLTENYLN